MPLTRLFALVFLLPVVGCSHQTFQVIATNKTDMPVTVGIVKDGPPYDHNLASPGEWAVDTRLDSLPPWGNVVPAGRTIDSGKVTGSFPSGTSAYLRVYRGEHSNAELIGIGEPSFDRVDIVLFPGPNEIVIENDPAKGLRYQRLRPAVAPR